MFEMNCVPLFRSWADLDIAGPAWAEHENPTRDAGGTGCFVRTLVELARGYANG
jgi:leucyl aminopeptidase